jgi:surface antigen
MIRTYAFLLQYIFKKTLFRFKRRFPGIKKTYAQDFPAMHLKLDAWQYLSKFSSELLVTTLVIIVAGTNLFFLASKTGYTDNSLFFAFLSHHVDLNANLYNHNSIVRTTVAPNGLIPAAYADTTTEALAADNPGGAPATSDGIDQTNFVDVSTDSTGTIIRPNPDSIAGMVAKQVKIYETQPGDFTVYPVAAKFGISYKTIMWANNLKDVNLKPGWKLLISPVDGVITQANDNTTLPDIANKYNVDINTIIAYNGLANAEDIEPGQIIIVPGGVPPAPPAAPKPKAPPRGNSGGNTDLGNGGGGHSFAWGYCTWYVAQKVHVPWGGNAKNWLGNARAMGYPTGKTPKVGAIFSSNASRKYGHVALVTAVKDGGFDITEMNYAGLGKITNRFIPSDSPEIVGFIYGK